MKNTLNIDRIRYIITPIADRYGVDRIYLFGSYARGDETSSSDIDLRIDKGRIRGLIALSGLKLDLEDQLMRNVDLLTTDSLSPDFLQSIQREEILLYEHGQK